MRIKRTSQPGDPPSARVTLLQGLALVLGSVVVGGLLAEGAVRLLLPPPERVTVDTSPDLDRRLAAENQEPKSVSYRGAINAMFEKTPTGRRLRANTNVTIENHYLSKRTITVRTNSLGFRGPELGEPRGTRVLFLGDSITMAHYLPEEETFVGLVGSLSAASGAPLETVNAGVGGIGLEAELAILLETGLRARPNIVVLDFYLNDVQQSPGVRILQVPAALRWSWLAQYVARSVPLLFARNDWEIGDQETGGWLDDLRRRFPAGPGDPATSPGAFNALVQENYQDWGSAWSDGAWIRIEPLLAEVKRQADLHGFELLVVCFPVAPQVEAGFPTDEPQRRLEVVTGRMGVPVLDLLPPLRAARKESTEPLFYDICHHTPRGSRVIADAILGFIREHPGR
jgi:hypothetical protein